MKKEFEIILMEIELDESDINEFFLNKPLGEIPIVEHRIEEEEYCFDTLILEALESVEKNTQDFQK